MGDDAMARQARHESHRNARTIFALTCLLALAGCAAVKGPAFVEPARLPAPSAQLAQPDRLRIVALNVGLLPGPLGHDNVRRARRICDHLLTQPGPDVIVLVEVFDETAREIITRCVHSTHPWIIRHAGGNGILREDSGILVASRYPLIRRGASPSRFAAFRARGPVTTSDYWCAKGVLGTEVDLGGGRSLCLFAAHLQADYERVGQYAGVRGRQLAELRQFAQTFIREVPRGRRTTALLVGDLNVVGEAPVSDGTWRSLGLRRTEEYERLADVLLDPSDLFRAQHPDEPGYTWNHDPHAPGADPAMGPQRLDYALCLDGMTPAPRRLPLSTAAVDTVTLAPGLSDHRGLAIELVLETPVLSASVATPSVGGTS
jgi:endonuclease/exonuclease/phosphatase family metal-dependent hydrolase